jgi:hypothetical protein
MSTRLVAAALAVLAPACGDVAATRSVQCGAQPVEVLPNPSFDATTPAWIQDPVTTALICGAPRITPVDGALAACLGATDGTVQTLSQQVALPAGAKTARLSGQICIATAETMAVDHDTLQFDLLDGATVIAALGKQTNRQGAATCQFAAFELTAAVASDPVTATLRIRSTLDTAMPTSFYLDALSLTVGCTP